MKMLHLLLALLLAPVVADAQTTTPPSPTSPPMAPSNIGSAHPGGFPWAIGIAIPSGQLLRSVWMPPQTVVIDTLVPVPAQPQAIEAAVVEQAPGAPAEQVPAPESAPQYAVWRQTLVVPGYWVRQTTAGAYYPERWMLEQVAPGSYRWRLLPAEVRAR